jgi:hypothetical protein
MEDIYSVADHPLMVEAVNRNLQRISACSHTIAVVREELCDPLTIDRRADLLVSVEDLVNEVMTLALDVRAIVWPDQLSYPVED